MFVHQRRRRNAPKQLRHNQQALADLLLLAVERLRSISGEVDHTAAAQNDPHSYTEEDEGGRRDSAYTRRSYAFPQGPWQLRDSAERPSGQT
jgi:hypothetical protein